LTEINYFISNNICEKAAPSGAAFIVEIVFIWQARGVEPLLSTYSSSAAAESE